MSALFSFLGFGGPSGTSKQEEQLDYKSFIKQLKESQSISLVKKIKEFAHSFNVKDCSSSKSLVHDFLSEIYIEMKEHPVFRDSLSSSESQNIREGLEKLVLTKIYDRAFPCLDVKEEGSILNQKIKLLSSFIRPAHLDLNDERYNNHPILPQAQESLRAMDDYKSPRDKLVCLHNCCKILTNLIRSFQSNAMVGADDFLPLLIYTILHDNPSLSLFQNLHFISSYRNPNSLADDEGLMFTHVVSACRFIIKCNHEYLTISKEEYDNAIIDATTIISNKDQNVNHCDDNVQQQQEEEEEKAEETEEKKNSDDSQIIIAFQNLLDVTTTINKEKDMININQNLILIDAMKQMQNLISNLHFEKVNYSDLSISNISLLLCEYKSLASMLQRFNKIINNTSYNSSSERKEV